MPVTCQFYDNDNGICAWCRLPQDQHRLRPCRVCHAEGLLPDPTDRQSHRANRPTWAWRRTKCGCNTGWVDTTTRRPAPAELIDQLRRHA